MGGGGEQPLGDQLCAACRKEVRAVRMAESKRSQKSDCREKPPVSKCQSLTLIFKTSLSHINPVLKPIVQRPQLLALT